VEIVLDHGQTFTVADHVVVPRNEVETNVVLLTSVDVETRKKDPGVSRFFTNVDSATITTDVRMPSFHNVRLVDKDIGIDVGCVDPMARDIQRQVASRGHRFRFYWGQSVAFRAVFRRFKSIALGSDRFAQIVIIISVLQEASELFVLRDSLVFATAKK